MVGSTCVPQLVVALAMILWTNGPASGDEQPPIEGDPKLLLLMRDAQLANVGRYPFGELEATAEIANLGEPPHRRVEALVRWDGDRQRVTGVLADRGTPPGSSEPRIFKKHFDLIYRDDRSIVYLPDDKLMTISSISRRGQSMLTDLRPQNWWYGKVNGEGRPWTEEYDRLLNRPPEFPRQVRVRRLDDDLVEMVCDAGKAGRYRLVSSLKDDGNPVLVEMVVPQIDFEENRTYSWSRDQRGRCHLRSCRVERHSRKQDDGTRSGLSYNYDVVRFDPDKRPHQSDFEDRALQVAPGTVVDDWNTGKRRRVGDRPVDGMGASLDRLVPEHKSRGFAAPARER